MLQMSWSWLRAALFPTFGLIWLSSFLSTIASQQISSTDRILATQCIAQAFAMVLLQEQMKRELFSHGFSLNNIASEEHKTKLPTKSETFFHAKWLTMLKCLRTQSRTIMLFFMLMASDLLRSTEHITVQIDNLLCTGIVLPFLADSLKVIDISSLTWRKGIQAFAIFIPVFRRYSE